MSTTLLDTIMCCTICTIVQDIDLRSYYLNNNHTELVTSDSYLTTTSDSDETLEQKHDKIRDIKTKEIEDEWLNSYRSSNSYDLSLSDYKQHCKIGALMLNMIGALEASQKSINFSESSSDEQQLVWQSLRLTETTPNDPLQ